MDVLFLNSSVFDIPSSRRVGALVHAGSTDMQLWPGPGSDRELNGAYGNGLQNALEVELEQLGLDELPLCGVARAHAGRLHCDMLVWVATHPPEPGGSRMPAPDAKVLEEAVLAVLEYVAKRLVVRVAFPALGDGPSELAAEDRLAAIVRAAHRYEDRCFAEGRAPVIEEVLVCDKSNATLSAAKRKVHNLAKTATMPDKPVATDDKKAARRALNKKIGSPTASKRKSTAKPSLGADEASTARASADSYDMRKAYKAGEYFIHPKFGVGRVELVTPEGSIDVVFEDGSNRKMVHARG